MAISRTAEALRESEACYRTLARESPEALFIYDIRQGGVTCLNRRVLPSRWILRLQHASP